MSELDSSLRDLRDDLRLSITRPDLALVAARARQRTVRRRTQIGAIATVVLVSVAVPVLRSLPVDQTSAHPSAGAPVGYQLEFADDTHGFALASDCAESCAFTLLATGDAGRSWEPRKVPVDGRRHEEAQLAVFDPDHLVIHAYSTRQGSVPLRYMSDDAGRTWRESVLETDSPRLIPSGAELMRLCGEVGDCASGLGAIGNDGNASFLVSQPPLMEPWPGRSPTAGGRYWAAGRFPTTGGWAISVTSDAGETWTTTPVDLPGEPWHMGEPWSVVENGGVMYATVTGTIGVGPLKLLTVYRSTDGGVSWTQQWRATQENVLMAVDGSAVATADGRLLVYSTVDGTQESPDGRTFARAERQLPGPVRWTRAGYLVAVKDNRYELSRDGREWRAFDVR
jgi:hypothetical protein